MANSDKSVVALRASTGAGKSIMAAVACKLYGDATYLAHSKFLQEQLIKDFPEFEILYGRANYECIHHSTLTCADCPYQSAKESCDDYWGCLYRRQKKKVLTSSLRILNYQYFILESNFVGQFAGKPLLICDEADMLENVLLDFIELQISGHVIKKHKLPKPPFRTVKAKYSHVEPLVAWSKNCHSIIKSHYNALPSDAPKKDIERVEGLMNKLNRFSYWLDDTWIFEDGVNKFGKYIKFSPRWITKKMTDEYLRQHVGDEYDCGKIVMMSATLPPAEVLSHTLGIPVGEMDYLETRSNWDTANMPIHITPVANMSYKTIEAEMPLMVKAIESILDKHKHEKGLIHTRKYSIRDAIMTINNDRLITHNSNNRIEQIEMFKQSKEPLVMVSPSMERGVSLNDDMVRFLCVCKAPFLDLGNKRVGKRAMESGRMGGYWYRADAAQTLEQMVGRGVRSKNDYCEIYLLDLQIEKLIYKYPTLFSEHFKSCIVL